MAIKAIVAHDCNGLRLMLPKHIISLLSSVNAHSIELATFEDNFCVIEADEYTIYFSTIEGRYPNYLSVKPSLENASRARCSRHALMAAIKRMQTMGNTCSGLTMLTFGSGIEGGLTLRSCDPDRGVGIRESLPAFTSHTSTFSIGACAAFALNVLSRLSGNTVHLYTTTDDKPVSFIGADETFYALTMPMSLTQTPEEFDKDYIEQIDEDDEESVDDQSADDLADEAADEIEENEESTEEKEDEV